MIYSKVMKFRYLQINSIDLNFVFIGENFVYVLFLFSYQRIYHIPFLDSKEFPRLLRNYRTFDAVWDFIVLDRTPQDFSGLPMRKWSLLHNNCAPISKVKKFRDLHNKSIDFVFWGDLCLCTIICFISEEISCSKRVEKNFQ